MKPEWVVNDMGELGVKIGKKFYFLYKGDSISYEDGLHDDGTPILWRMVGKREFGETCQPLPMFMDRWRNQTRYLEPLVHTPGLSFGKPGDGDWKPMPCALEPQREQPK